MLRLKRGFGEVEEVNESVEDRKRKRGRKKEDCSTSGVGGLRDWQAGVDHLHQQTIRNHS